MALLLDKSKMVTLVAWCATHRRLPQPSRPNPRGTSEPSAENSVNLQMLIFRPARESSLRSIMQWSPIRTSESKIRNFPNQRITRAPSRSQNKSFQLIREPSLIRTSLFSLSLTLRVRMEAHMICKMAKSNMMKEEFFTICSSLHCQISSKKFGLLLVDHMKLKEKLFKFQIRSSMTNLLTLAVFS